MTIMKDYKLRSLIPDRNYSTANIKLEHIQRVGASFYENMGRVDSLSNLPALVFLLADEYAKKGRFDFQYQASSTNTTAGYGLGGDSPDYQRATARLEPGMDRIQELAEFPPASAAIESWMASLLLGTWTAIENLAADLWVTALNTFPAGLAELTGTPKRIGKLAGEKSKLSSDEISDGSDLSWSPEDKSISLREIHQQTQGSYDLSGKMGSILKGRFKFTTLKGIREAYSSAFSEKQKKARTASIDSALAEKGLDALSAVRNLIVHKAGIADAEYEEKVKNIPIAPQLKARDKLELDGDICRTLIDLCVGSSMKLIGAVDSWLMQTKEND
jgi:hypothetical protein